MKKIPIKTISKLALKSYRLAITQRDTAGIIGRILEKIHPELEEELRDGHSFLDEMMDYGNCVDDEDEILKQINNKLSLLNLNSEAKNG